MGTTEYFNLVVAGAGSGGLGAALAAARLGLSVLLIEKGPGLGGTAVLGGVSTWEAGVGGTGLPFEIYRRLKKIPRAVGIYMLGRHGERVPPGQPVFPGAEMDIDPQGQYTDTLRRHPDRNFPDKELWRAGLRAVVFEPDAYARVVGDMLAEAKCVVRLNSELADVSVKAGRIVSATCRDGNTLKADMWIDATGNGDLCLACGCAALRGVDPRSRFNEPGAPLEASPAVNGVTLIYRIAPTRGAGVQSLPPDTPDACWWAPRFPPVVCVCFPNGGLTCNMLPTMSGAQFSDLPYASAYAECVRRARAHWHFMQTTIEEFQQYRIAWIAPQLGVRETNRIVCEHMLTENDIRQGLSGQSAEDIVALSDHALDRHPGGCQELHEPYGVPFRSLIPKGFRNLLVACRAAGFSSIAASSCRLARTMMQLGQAAGTAAALAAERHCELSDMPGCDLRAALRAQHVQLEWPLEDAVRRQMNH